MGTRHHRRDSVEDAMLRISQHRRGQSCVASLRHVGRHPRREVGRATVGAGILLPLASLYSSPWQGSHRSHGAHGFEEAPSGSGRGGRGIDILGHGVHHFIFALIDRERRLGGSECATTAPVTAVGGALAPT